jgi:hypothetical protein
MTTVLSRGNRGRRGGRRPGWELSALLLVLAIAASSALIFTSRVELLKLAVILALWAAVVAAFASVIYRRQSDADQARARDLKLVYDLQLEREISARREYELTVESQLRRELASELRAQAADEVAGLREELAALRMNLEILFDADLEHRPALETERTTVRAYSDWDRNDGAQYNEAQHDETQYDETQYDEAQYDEAQYDEAQPQDTADRTEENPIIDVSEVGVPAGAGATGSPQQRRQRFSAQHPRQQPETAVPRPEPRPRPWPHAPEPAVATTDSWSAQGDWSTGGAPAGDRASAQTSPTGRHGEGSRHAHTRHATESANPPPASTARHRSADPETDNGADGPPTGGESVSELLARLQTGSTGRRRHRREE